MGCLKFAVANPAATIAAEMRSIKLECIKDMEMYLKHQLLLAGLLGLFQAEAMKEAASMRPSSLWPTSRL